MPITRKIYRKGEQPMPLTAEQLAETARRYFSGYEELLLLAIDPALLGDALKFEPSRDGALFPHIHGPLPLVAVVSVTPFDVIE
jgi:uncharacterized protein (DUF952 family)